MKELKLPGDVMRVSLRSAFPLPVATAKICADGLSAAAAGIAAQFAAAERARTHCSTPLHSISRIVL